MRTRDLKPAHLGLFSGSIPDAQSEAFRRRPQSCQQYSVNAVCSCSSLVDASPGHLGKHKFHMHSYSANQTMVKDHVEAEKSQVFHLFSVYVEVSPPGLEVLGGQRKGPGGSE